MYCPNCGTENDERGQFCKDCGQALSRGEGLEDAAQSTRPAVKKRILVGLGIGGGFALVIAAIVTGWMLLGGGGDPPRAEETAPAGMFSTLPTTEPPLVGDQPGVAIDLQGTPAPTPTSIPTAAAVSTPGPTAGPSDQVTVPEKPKLKYPKVGSTLDRLIASVAAREVSAADAARQAPLHRGEAVAVTIYLSGNVDGMVGFLEANGVSPRNVGEDFIEAYVPITLLGKASEQPGVLRVRVIIPVELSRSAARIPGLGPQAHGSPAWNEAGYTGKDIKVGVIDGGFTGFSGLMGTELPPSVQVSCRPSNSDRRSPALRDCEHTTSHGTAVAEAVMDIAPEVSLYLANVKSKGDLRIATDWMIEQGVDVINLSGKFQFDGPGDGTSRHSDSPLRTVDRAVERGIVWVNSAGNYAEQTWFGSPSDSDGDGYIEFTPGDETNTVRFVGAVKVELRWDDSWGGATRDLDFILCDVPCKPPEGGFSFGAGSLNFQSGGSEHDPIEYYYEPRMPSNSYDLVVFNRSPSMPAWVQLMVRGTRISLEHYTSRGSIGNPAESASPGMLTVGAAAWESANKAIRYYSSRGPTPDGRVKPDLIGADCGDTAVRDSPFCGTSQAAPHVAGLAALIRQRFPEYSPDQVVTYLKEHADRHANPNNTWGHGFIKLPPPASSEPTPLTVPTAVPTTVPVATRPPVPTAIPTTVPTATLPPVPTTIPIPTSVPAATSPPLPTAIPTTVPAATPPPVPTAMPTSVPVPTPPPDPTAVPATRTNQPNVPANVRYMYEGATIRLSWDPVSGADYYKVYYDDFHKSGCRLGRNGQPSFCEELAAQVTATAYVHASPDPQSNYYWVTACNSEGCSVIDSANPATAPTPPNAPSNARYARAGATIRVSWGPVDGADYYKVYYDDFHKASCRLGRNGQPSFCEELAAQVTVTTYVHATPHKDRNYYWVTACGSGGCSAIDSRNPAEGAG